MYEPLKWRHIPYWLILGMMAGIIIISLLTGIGLDLSLSVGMLMVGIMLTVQPNVSPLRKSVPALLGMFLALLIPEPPHDLWLANILLAVIVMAVGTFAIREVDRREHAEPLPAKGDGNVHIPVVLPVERLRCPVESAAHRRNSRRRRHAGHRQVR